MMLKTTVNADRRQVTVLQEAIRAKHQSGCPSNQLRTYAIPKLDSDYFDEEREF